MFYKCELSPLLIAEQSIIKLGNIEHCVIVFFFWHFKWKQGFRFNRNESDATRPPTVGMVDMGGASLQIAIELGSKDRGGGHATETVNLGCRDDSDVFRCVFAYIYVCSDCNKCHKSCH